jgi:RimJ/RimL family protein N-acetyltransferase
MTVLETERLRLRRLREDDAAFILELVNEPAWLRFIGDKGVRTLDDARAYLEKGPLASYERFGFGLYLVELKASGTAVGICGLIRRDTLSDVDLGFAFLSRFHGNGYARESAAAALEYGRDALGLDRIVAITLPENHASIRVLERVGFALERRIMMSGDSEEIALYASDAAQPDRAERSTTSK